MKQIQCVARHSTHITVAVQEDAKKLAIRKSFRIAYLVIDSYLNYFIHKTCFQ